MSSPNLLSAIEKLQGRENYSTWRFAMSVFLEHEGLDKCIDGTETDVKKLSRARTSIILSIDKVNYIHVQEAKTAKAVWDTLKATFDDSGLARKVGLLRTLITTRLENCASMEVYVNEIIGTAHKLNGVGMEVTDEWIGSFLLAGLSEEYRPMIMAIENSGADITGDSIKTKLLQEVKNDTNASALFNSRSYKGNSRRYSKSTRCYECNQQGHISTHCPKKHNGGDNSSSSSSGGSSGGGDNSSTVNSQHSSKSSNNTSKNNTAYVKSSRVTPVFSAAFLTGKFNQSDWFIDSGSSYHMSMRQDWFGETNNPGISEITTANNSKMKVVCVGDINISVQREDAAQTVLVRNVLCVPDLTANLLSVSRIVENGNTIEFVDGGCRIYNSNRVLLATATLLGNLYRLNIAKNTALLASGHLNESVIIKERNNPERGVYFNDSNASEACVACISGIESRKTCPSVESSTIELLALVHSGLYGPMETMSIGGARYLLVFVDDYSRMVFAYFIKTKSDIYETFVRFQLLVENQLGKRIKCLRFKNRKDFYNEKFRAMFEKSGISHQTSTQFIGLAERKIRTIIEKAKSLLIDADFDNCLWAEAVNTAVYMENRMVSSVLDNKTPYEIWTGKMPSVGHFRMFGSTVMVHMAIEEKLKRHHSSKKCRMVGYCETSKSYRLYDPVSKSICKSRNVEFIEKSNAPTDDACFIPVLFGADRAKASSAKSVMVAIGDTTNDEDESISNEFNDMLEDLSSYQVSSLNATIFQSTFLTSNSNCFWRMAFAILCFCHLFVSICEINGYLILLWTLITLLVILPWLLNVSSKVRD